MSDWNGKPQDWGKGVYRDIEWSRFVLLARDRQKRDLERSLNDPAFPYYFDDEQADHVVNFFELLRHFDSPWTGQPFILADWQEWDIVRPLFGWKRRADHFRRFRYFYIEVARKNGKSTLGAGISNYMWLGDREYGAQCYAAATKEEQAKIVWQQARRMVELSPTLSKYMQPFKASVYCPKMGATFRPLGRDSNTQDGWSVHYANVDEYHAHRSSDMYDVLSTGMGARPNSMIGIITTAGANQTGPCKGESDKAKRLLQGELENDSTFTFVATVDNVEKWDEESEWIKANPNYGITIFPHVFKDGFEQAKSSAIKENAFKNKCLNIWTTSSVRWITSDAWQRSDGRFDPKKLLGKRCFAGLDLGITRDLSAFVMMFLDDKDPEDIERDRDVYLLARYWMPEANVEKRYKEDGVKYPDWIREGRILTIPGETTRTDPIRAEINRLGAMYEIAEIAIDRYNAVELAQQLADDNFTVVKHAQTMSAMNFPCRSFEEHVLQRRIKANCDPVFAWMLGNSVVVRDSNDNMKLEKSKSGERIDGVVAGVMALGRLLIAPQPIRDPYADNDIMTVAV